MRHFSCIDSAAKELAERLAQTLNEAILERGRATIAVSGGQTPRYVFHHLLNKDISWDRVTITLTDERWVPPDHSQSNERLVRNHLMIGKAKVATFVPMFGGEPSPESGQAACERRLLSIGGGIDAVYLGMGIDGHIASLFPGHDAVCARGGFCIPVSAPDVSPPRMSLTVGAIMGSKKVYLLFAGPEKHATYRRALHGNSCREIPLRIIYSAAEEQVEVLAAP